jgi:GH25 family lysozyme M1 (1,4-beta-N-acetylmuramidase)
MNPLCIDVSHHQPEPNWARVKAGGTVGAILKATEGLTYVDPVFGQRREAARAANLAVSSYHFLKHGQVGQQMAHYLDVVSPQRGERVVIDYEDTSCSLADLREAVLALQAAGLDLQITIYGGGMLKGQLGDNHDEVLVKTSLWIAHYTSMAQPVWPKATWPVWTLWQYTDSATVDGIQGPVDGNRFNGPAGNLLKWLRPSTPGQVLPAPPTPVPYNFAEGEAVKKITGYPYPGEVRAVFQTKAGETRYVVEATGADYAGMLHIFSGEQLGRDA